MRCARSGCKPCSGARPKASSGTRLSPATTTSATKPWSAHRCATSCMTATVGSWPCSGSPPRHANWRRARPLHRLDADTAGEESAQGHRQRPFPHPALDTHPQSRLAHPVRRVPTVDRGLESHHAPVDRVRGDHWRHLPHGPMSASPRDADGTTGTRNTTSPSGCGPCAKTGNGRSTTNPNDRVDYKPLDKRRNGENRYPTTRHPPRTERLPIENNVYSVSLSNHSESMH